VSVSSVPLIVNNSKTKRPIKPKLAERLPVTGVIRADQDTQLHVIRSKVKVTDEIASVTKVSES